MKIRRLRRVRRYLGFYKNNFGFRTPYQVLIDATFCQEALGCKLNIQEQMPKYLESEIKFLTTACVITEATSLGSVAYGGTQIVKQFVLRKCGHEKNPIPASDCLQSMLSENNVDHYFIATQDMDLSNKIRELPGVPLLYVKYNAIILEKPSMLNSEIAQLNAEEKLKVTDYSAEVIKRLKTETFGEDVVLKKKKKKIKNPNPLSCLKKKKIATKSQDQEKIRKRPRHKRNKKSQMHEMNS